MPDENTADTDNRFETYKHLTAAQSTLFDALGTAQKGLLRNPSPELARSLDQTILDLNEQIAILETRILAVRRGTAAIPMPTDAQVAAISALTAEVEGLKNDNLTAEMALALGTKAMTLAGSLAAGTTG